GSGILRGAPGAVAFVSPASAAQGQILSAALHGANTEWVAGQTTASFGSGIAVGGAASRSPRPVTVTDQTDPNARPVVAQNATLGQRTVTVTVAPQPGFTQGESDTLANAFTVTPAILSATQTQPAAALPGQQVSITVNAANNSSQLSITGISVSETFTNLTPSTAAGPISNIAPSATGSRA